MSVDWTQSEFVYLLSKLRQGQVCLFAGAGFSLGAKNNFGKYLPLGGKLAELLAQKAGETYSGESLPTVFEAVETTIGTNNIWSYLKDLYKVKEASEWYKIVTSLTWYRIYTTNIDDLFQFLLPYPSGQRLELHVRGDQPEERDPHFERLQCVHLHGHVDYRHNGLTFTPGDFATHTARPDPWYQNLVNDLHSMPVIFIGTELEEPILNHFLELREPKPRGAGQEWRPKSFLISPSIGGLKAKALQSRNILSVPCTAQEFFESITKAADLSEFRISSVQSTVWPHLFGSGRRVATSIASAFDLIIPGELPNVRPDAQSRFFLGAEPTWDDIDKHRDGEREINRTLLESIQEPSDKFRFHVLHGPAGCGKTTTLMRLAHDIATAGGTTYFARGIQRIDWEGILKLSKERNSTKERLFVFVDVISRHVGQLVAIGQEFDACASLTLIVADRTNAYVSRCQRLGRLEPIEISMPDLFECDVESILERLDYFGFLGVLKGRPHTEQVQEFMIRAQRQLLVAMREATSGKEFDLILQDEFHNLAPEAQLAYTICSIAVSQGAPGVYIKHLLPCMRCAGSDGHFKCLIQLLELSNERSVRCRKERAVEAVDNTVTR